MGRLGNSVSGVCVVAGGSPDSFAIGAPRAQEVLLHVQELPEKSTYFQDLLRLRRPDSRAIRATQSFVKSILYCLGSGLRHSTSDASLIKIPGLRISLGP